MPHAAGYLVQAEVTALSKLTGDIRRPYVVVLGGAKVTDKFGAIDSLIAIADKILVGGAMAFPFLVAQGCRPISPWQPARPGTARPTSAESRPRSSVTVAKPLRSIQPTTPSSSSVT
jgi:hypothetical protein